MNAANGGKNILLVGVGGQGVLLLSNIIAQAALAAGYEIKTNEVHGMAQRGGSVLAQVRFGPKVYSPLVWEGTADLILSLEESEALRYAQFLKPDGLAVVSNQRIIPVTVSSGQAKYPDDVAQRLARVFPRLIAVDAVAAAHSLGNVKAANVVTLGAAAAELHLSETDWAAALAKAVPAKHLELNTNAFAAGRKLAK